MHKALLLIVTLVFSTAAAAQQYKWVDKDGKVRYGDVPPPGANASRLRPPPPGSAPAPAASAAPKKDGAKALTPEEAFRQRQEAARKDADKQAKADQEKAESQANCARAQDVLRALESGQRIARTDSKGERYYLEDAQVAQETAAARQSVRQHCK